MGMVYNPGMKRVLFLLSALTFCLYAGALRQHAQPSYATVVPLLKSIEQDAIVLGSGKQVVYVFVDPLCPHSRKFIAMVSHSERMLSKYRYHIFLYSIPRLKSETTVSAIYRSPVPRKALLRVMVDKGAIEPVSAVMTEKTVSEIAAVAQKIGVYKRPYLFMTVQE